MISLRVPATSANIGPGFDTLGIALQLYMYLKASKREDAFRYTHFSENSVSLADCDNLVKTTIDDYLDANGYTNCGYDLYMEDCEIPISRGLGSSAAAIVGGLYIAYYLTNKSFDKNEIISLGTALEGHPDNIVPAVVGNMTISLFNEQNVIYETLSFPTELCFKVMIPDFVLSTSMAREVLPTKYEIKDVVKNLSRIGLLINAMYSKKFEHLKYALGDSIHQPYRMQLIESSELIFKSVEKTEAYGIFISGAGPTLIAITHLHDATFEASMTPFLNSRPSKWDLFNVQVDPKGVHYEIDD